VIREGTNHEGKPLGWYRTKEEAQAAIDAYESRSEPTVDAGITDSDLPYAIRVYAQAKKVNDSLTFEETQKQTLEINSVSRDERDWHHPGERGEAITRIRWRHEAARDIKDLAQACVEAEVVKLAEKLMPSVVSKLLSDVTPTFMVKTAFTIAQAFIDEQDARALAIRTANVDSLLDPHNNQPKGE
jgi:hypothetical protein